MLDLSSHAEALKSIFERYPAGKYCDECAFAVSMILERGYAVSIMTIKNRETGDLKPFRPPFIQAHLPDGKEFTIGSQGYHKAVRIEASEVYVIDALVYGHVGFHALAYDRYLALFSYPNDLEITKVE